MPIFFHSEDENHVLFFQHFKIAPSLIVYKNIKTVHLQMHSFRFINPSPLLAPYIRHYWILECGIGTSTAQRIPPIGCIQMIFHRRKRLFIEGGKLQPRSFISGQNIRFYDVASSDAIEMITVVFQPYAAKIFLGIPVSLFHGQHIALDELNDSQFSDLSKQVEDAPNIDMCIYHIEQFLTYRLYEFSGHNIKRISTALDKINTQSQVNTSQLSDITCLSNKQFSRIFGEYVGTTPKDFMRIIRMQRALYTLQNDPSIPFVELAHYCGFSDQSHMIKEFKHFSGYTPAKYISSCSPYSDYFSAI